MADSYIAHSPEMGKDLTGIKFGRLTPLGLVSRTREEEGLAYVKIWECRCDCGKIARIKHTQMTGGITKSCGCFRRETTAKNSTTHGLRSHPLWWTWHRIKQRCHNPKNPKYPDYGARGICVEEPWRSSFQAFYDDMISKWKPELSIDRRDNNKNYCKGNCRWADDFTQASNKRSNCWIEFNGQKKLRSHWARELGIPDTTILLRLRRGWSIEKALTTTPLKCGRFCKKETEELW